MCIHYHEGFAIVGGTSFGRGDYPHYVSVQIGATKNHICGGSIINDQWVLCPAHCLKGYKILIDSVLLQLKVITFSII